MRRIVLSQYESHKVEINIQKAPDTVLAVNNQRIHNILERIVYLQDSIREFEKFNYWGFVDDYQRVFLQHR
jgi:hypothetical protein